MREQVRHTLFLLDPADADRNRMVGWGADLVEAFTAPIEDGKDPVGIVGVIAEPGECLEVGLAVLGRVSPPTVEGGKRATSPVILFPYSHARINVAVREGEGAILATAWSSLIELAKAGAVEGVTDAVLRDNRLPTLEQAFGTAMANREWGDLVVLGDKDTSSKLAQGFEDSRKNNRVIRPIPDKELGDRVNVLLAALEKDQKDDLTEARRAGVLSAIQFKELLYQLGLAE